MYFFFFFQWIIHHNTGQTYTVTHLRIVLNGGLFFYAEKNKGPS